MFDRITRNTNVTFPGTIEVNEHKAPTDESIRIFDEFKDKALKRVIKSMKVENNVFKASILAYAPEMITDEVSLYIKFNLNGHEYSFTERVHNQDLRQEFSKWTGLVSGLSMDQALIVQFSKVLMKHLVVGSKYPVQDWKATEYMIDSVDLK
jgi:hypothetical protein